MIKRLKKKTRAAANRVTDAAKAIQFVWSKFHRKVFGIRPTDKPEERK